MSLLRFAIARRFLYNAVTVSASSPRESPTNFYQQRPYHTHRVRTHLTPAPATSAFDSLLGLGLEEDLATPAPRVAEPPIANRTTGSSGATDDSPRFSSPKHGKDEFETAASVRHLHGNSAHNDRWTGAAAHTPQAAPPAPTTLHEFINSLKALDRRIHSAKIAQRRCNMDAPLPHSGAISDATAAARRREASSDAVRASIHELMAYWAHHIDYIMHACVRHPRDLACVAFASRAHRLVLPSGSGASGGGAADWAWGLLDRQRDAFGAAEAMAILSMLSRSPSPFALREGATIAGSVANFQEGLAARRAHLGFDLIGKFFAPIRMVPPDPMAAASHTSSTAEPASLSVRAVAASASPAALPGGHSAHPNASLDIRCAHADRDAIADALDFLASIARWPRRALVRHGIVTVDYHQTLQAAKMDGPKPADGTVVVVGLAQEGLPTTCEDSTSCAAPGDQALPSALQRRSTGTGPNPNDGDAAALLRQLLLQRLLRTALPLCAPHLPPTALLQAAENTLRISARLLPRRHARRVDRRAVEVLLRELVIARADKLQNSRHFLRAVRVAEQAGVRDAAVWAGLAELWLGKKRPQWRFSDPNAAELRRILRRNADSSAQLHSRNTNL